MDIFIRSCAVLSLALGVSAAVSAGPGADAEVFRSPANAAPPSASLRSGGLNDGGIHIDLGPVAQPRSQSTGADTPPDDPKRVGFGRDLPPELSKLLDAQSLTWSATPDGGRLAVLRLTSQGARAVRAGIQVYGMPGAAQLRFFSPGMDGAQVFALTGAEINRTLERDRAARDPDSEAALLYWSPVAEGDTIGIEIYLPAGIGPEQVRIAVPRVSHIYDLPLAPAPQPRLGIGDSGTCTVDLACHSGYWDEVGDAVARMLFTLDDGGTSACSGTLIADRDPSTQVPYFITAHHCISTQPVASSLQTFWFFRTAGCGGSVDRSRLRTLGGGSTVLATLPEVDTTLLRLNVDPPEGSTLAGWDAAPVGPGASVASISHPQGDLLKLATGFVHGYTSCLFSPATGYSFLGCGESPSGFGDYLYTTFNYGMPQQGSSGSGIFLSESKKLVGITSTAYWIDTNGNGQADCGETLQQVNYGRFDIAYNNKLKHWLGGKDSCTAAPGSWAYCTNPACGPCDAGEGDCDSNDECKSGLVCAADAGGKYGFGATVDVCETPAQAGVSPGCTLAEGDWDYCADPRCGPCGEAQGDCDSDSECQGALVCKSDDGAAQGFDAKVDVCAAAAKGSCSLVNGDWAYCSDKSCGPCAAGKGDCDSDTDCAAGLFCASNVGAKYGLPATMDVCEAPPATACTKTPGDWGYCSDPACGPCTDGQGDCDADSECADGLTCAANVGESYGLPETLDVCRAPGS